MKSINNKVREADDAREKSATGYRTASGSDRIPTLNSSRMKKLTVKVDWWHPVATARGSVSD
jgi:hypothetical protein